MYAGGMPLSNISTAARNAQADGFVDQLDVGSTDAAGDLQIRTAAGATLLAELVFSAPAFGSAASGTATANAITDEDDAPASGTAAVLRLRDRDNATVADGTVGEIGSGEDLELNTLSIAAADAVAVTAATITAPASG